jgi:RHS repeat-associated protein
VQQEMSSAAFTSGSGGPTACTAQSGATLATNLATYSASNQIVSTNARGVSVSPMYDAAGDMSYDGTNQYLYDAEGRVCAVQSTSMPGMTSMTGYLYDADGARVAKGTITSMNCDPTANGFQFSESYVLGPGDEELTIFSVASGVANWQRTNVYAAGILLATYDAAGLHFHLTDPLGTRRMQLSGEIASLGQPETDFQSLPFGDQLNTFPDRYAPASADDSTPLHFTGKERDTESGNDYFGKRYYASSMGRWMSPDVVNVTEERLMNPSSTLNKYVYGADNPLKFVDPDGQDITYFYDQSGFAGHAVLFAYNQANGDSAIESFGPASKSVGYRIAEPFMPVPGTGMFDMADVKSADDLRSTYASLTIQTTPELTQQVIDFIRSNPDPKLWDVMGPNCSSEVWKILQKFKLDYRGFGANQGMTPKILWSNLYMRYVDPNRVNVPQNGKDYGAPRFDMFSLMWLSLPQAQPKEVVTHRICDENGQNCH